MLELTISLGFWLFTLSLGFCMLGYRIYQILKEKGQINGFDN